jgi:predicted P-loop ATPase
MLKGKEIFNDENIVDEQKPVELNGYSGSETIGLRKELMALVDVRLNVILNKIEIRFKGGIIPNAPKTFVKINNQHIKDLKMLITAKKKYQKVTKDKIEDQLGSSFISIPYDPIKEKLMGLKRWDGAVDYIKKYTEQIILEDKKKYAHLVDAFTRWIVGNVASIVGDKIVNQLCFVLTGRQGRMKTTFLNNLVYDEFQLDYLYNGIYKTQDKEHETFLGVKWLINLDELATLNRTDIESLKSRMSQSQIEVRRPFERHSENYTRRASFCGSINASEFLTDLTGNRRFLPFRVRDINLDKKISLDDLYSQAIALFRSGFKYWYSPEEIDELEMHNDEFKRKSTMEDYIMDNYVPVTKEEIKIGHPNIIFRSANEILKSVVDDNPRMNQNETNAVQIGKFLGANGFVVKYQKKKGYRSNKRVWAVKIQSEVEYEYVDEEMNTAKTDENII